MVKLTRPVTGAALLVIVSQVLASCSTQSSPGPLALQLNSLDEIVFLVQSEDPTATMEALFEGRVVADQRGCLRLATADQHTVVWPKGFAVERRNGELWVLSPAGREVGRVGGTFGLEGGEVPFLHGGVPMASADRARANESCPGRFWIVGEIPRS